MKLTRVVVVTVVYGNRLPFLKKVVDSVIEDPKITHIIIVDNNCTGIPQLKENYSGDLSDKITILHQEKNIGYSGAIHAALQTAKQIDCDHVFILDDDSVPEKGAVDRFIDNLTLIGDPKTILAANRIDVPGNKNIFKKRPLSNTRPTMTIFKVFTLGKIYHAYKFIFKIKDRVDYPFIPIVPVESVVTGGSFIPISAIRETPLPDKNFFIYGEDLEFSWNMYKKGYRMYVCAQPIIRDIDMTFNEEGGHISGLFAEETPDFKVYFRIRNSVIISKRHSSQPKTILLLSVVTWMVALFMYCLCIHGPSKHFIKRSRLIILATQNGFKENFQIPDTIDIPGR